MSNLNLSDTEQRVEIFQSRLRTDYAAKIQEVAKLTDVVAKLQTQLLDVEHENNVLRQQLVISKKRIDELEKGTGLASEKQNYSILAADISTVHLKPSLKRERSPSLEILDVPQPTSKKARRKEREQDPATSTDVDHRPTSAKVRTKGILAVSESDSEKETDPGANSDSSQNSESSCINPQHSSTWKKQLKNTTELTLPKFLVETYMRDANALKIRPHPIDLKVSQAFLAMNYGGSKSTSLLFGHFNKNNPPGLNPRQRCFPLLSRHPGMPTRPGSPGLFVLDPQQVRSPLSLFCSSSNSYKYSDWLYLGEYEFFPVGKMSPECFKVQSLKAKQRWARLIHKQRRIFAYRLIRARIALRLSSIIPIDDKQEEQSIIQKEVTMIKKGQGRPVSEDDVIAAYSNGEEHIDIFRAHCIKYDHVFANDMKSRFLSYIPPGGGNQSEDSDKEKSSSDSDSDNPAPAPKSTAIVSKKQNKSNVRALVRNLQGKKSNIQPIASASSDSESSGSDSE